MGSSFGDTMASLKSASTNVGKAVFIALGVPYGIAIVVNSVHGWPQSDISHSRFTKQLLPSRVLNLNYALFQQVLMVKWVPLVLQARSVHRKADSSLQNIPFGENGLKMDVWLPKKRVLQSGAPVIFFIYGGAWGSGYKELYAKLGQELAETIGAVVVIPDYRIFPKGIMADMVVDIVESIHEFRTKHKVLLKLPDININNVTLIGHSAGAHLCTMTAICIATNDCETSIKIGSKKLEHNSFEREDQKSEFSQGPSQTVERGNNGDVSAEDGKTGIAFNDSSEAPESQALLVDLGEEQNDRKWETDLADSLKGVIGIGGVYHIMDHYHHEATRGVEDLSPMWRAAEGLQNFEKYSPTLVVPKLTKEQKHRLPPHMLIHGTKDITVPDSSSLIYADVLAEAGVPTQLKSLIGGGHAELVMDMMDPARKWYSATMGAIMEGMRKFLGEEYPSG